MASHKDMKEALSVMKILSHPVRLSILCNLIEKGEMSAGDICEQERRYASQSQTSQYLKVLRSNGMVTARRDGHYMHYNISSDSTEKLVLTLRDLYC